MKAKDIEALGLPAQVALDTRALGSWSGGVIKATALEAGCARRHAQKRDGVRVRTEQDWQGSGLRSLKAGHELVVAGVHVLRAWTEADEVDGVAALLGPLAAGYGLIPHADDLDVTAYRDGTFSVSVDGDALASLLAVFALTKQSEHYELAVLARAGDENARGVIEAMDSIERARFGDVARYVAREFAPAGRDPWKGARTVSGRPGDLIAVER